MILFFILILSVFHVTMIDYLYNNPTFYQLDAYTWESDDFRSLELGKMVAEWDSIDYGALTSLMIEHQYDLTGVKDGEYHTDRLMKVKPAEYRKLKQAYEMILKDLKFFPIPYNVNPDSPDVTYQNGWMDTRTYGGERGHEGCDIMGTERSRGYYPVVSMSGGVVEKVGWLEKGGWRMGIRAPGGAYLYYAHLYGYSREWKEGDPVKAGELLGFMGDTGYSEIEGTTGNFDVHLHVGIYLKTDHMDEMSVNPYWVLKYLEKYRLKYSY
ncbi:M23 family metallopeptidase [Lachnospiraceae bacterium 54-53]